MASLIDHIIEGFTPGAVGIWLVAGMLLVHFVREWRLTHSMTLADRIARRDGYAKQVESLQNENRSLRAEMHQMNEHHEQYRQMCHRENDQLRTMIINLETEVEGLKRNRTVDLLNVIRDGGTLA